MSIVSRWIVLSVLVALQAQAADQWQHVTKKSQPLLPGDEIQLIKVEDAKGPIWIGTLTGAAKIEGGVISQLKQTENMKVWDVTKRPGGGLWFGHGGGAMLIDGDRTVKALNGYNVPKIHVVGTQLWAIAKTESTDRNTLMQANGEEWAPVALFKDRNVQDLVQDSKGTFWLMFDMDGVVEIDPKKDLKDFSHHLSKQDVKTVMTDSKGRTWCGLRDGGTMVRQDNKWNSHLGRERPTVLSMVEANDGKIWAASNNGLWVFDGKDWKGMLQDEGSVNLLAKTSDGRIWVSTQKRGGLRYWSGNEWKESMDSPMPIRCLVELPNGVLLVGGVLDGLHILGNYSIKGE